MNRVSPGPYGEVEVVNESKSAARDPRGLLLIAEDEEMNMIILVKRLRREGYETMEVSNGAEAVSAARALRSSNPLPIVVLMDINMPIMDGFEATRILKYEWSELPVIAVTACGFNAKDFLELGFDALCRKPIDFKDLLAKIAKSMAPDRSRLIGQPS